MPSSTSRSADSAKPRAASKMRWNWLASRLLSYSGQQILRQIDKPRVERFFFFRDRLAASQQPEIVERLATGRFQSRRQFGQIVL